MKIPILLTSMSADHPFKKGDRVICKIAKDEWYVGTVVRAGAKVKVDFDDDFDAVIDENDFKHIKHLVKDKKTKKALTDLEAKALYEQKKTLKEAVKKPLIPTKKPQKIKIEPKKPFIPAAPPKPVKVSQGPAEPPIKVIPTKVATSPVKPVLAPAPAPTPPIVEKPKERVYKNNWIIQVNGANERSWRYVVLDDPKEHTFKFAAATISASAYEAVKHALLSMKGEKFTIQIKHPNGEVDTLNGLTKETALDEVGRAVKARTPAPTVKAPVKPTVVRPPVTPIHSPVTPTAVHDADKWAIYLTPDQSGSGDWEYAVRKTSVRYPFFIRSDFDYMTALDAYMSGAKKYIEADTFSIHIVEEMKGNAITRATVFDNVNYEKGLRLVDNFMKKLEQESAPDSFVDPFANGDKPLYLQVADAINYARAGMGQDHHKITYMHNVWKTANAMIFGGRLRNCSFRFLKNQQKESFRKRGHWSPAKREIAVSRRTFLAEEKIFLETFIHEMCHQAVTDIDHAIDPNGGHGPRWTAWMVKCGIPPNRYDTTDAKEYMTDAERIAQEEKEAAYKRAMAQPKTPITNKSAIGTPCQIYLDSHRDWVQGVTAGIFDSKLVFLDKLTSSTWITLPNQGKDRLYYLPAGEMKQDFYSEEWQNAARAVIKYMELRKAGKKFQKMMKKHMY